MHKPVSLQLPALLPGKEALFISDLHFGCDTVAAERDREDRWLQFLKERQEHLQYLFCLGDIFHAWYISRKVLPKGFVRFQAYLSTLMEEGILVYFLLGNHEFRKDHISSKCQLLSKHYLHQELGIFVYDGALCPTIGEIRLYLAHGDIIEYGWLHKFVTLPLLRCFISVFHPDIFLLLVEKYGSSQKKYATQGIELDKAKRLDTFPAFLRKKIEQEEASAACHYYVLGHTHMPNRVQLAPNSHYINLGAGTYHSTYGRLDSTGQFTLHTDKNLDIRS